MANRADLINPDSKTSIVFSDITENLSVSGYTGNLALVINEQDIIASYKRRFMISQYEREYDETGVNLKRLLFEPFDELTTIAIKETITQACMKESRGKLLEVLVNAYPDESAYVVSVSIEVRNRSEPITFSTVLKRIR